jgi:HAE1 family hydrophobic/amphiphilic exporter-1
MYRLAKLSLANRSVVALITLIIAAFGVMSLSSLKQELIPSFETPQASIITTYPGASAEVIDKTVSQKVEAQIRTLDGLVTTTSTSQNNLSIVRVEFEYGTTTAKVKENLNSVISTVQASLPEAAKPRVVAGSFDSVPIISIGISSSDNEKLGPILENEAPSIFGNIKGVRDVNVAGIKVKRINLKLNNTLLAKNGLSQQSVVQAIQQSGFIVPAGSIRDNTGEISLQVGTPVESIAALKSLALVPSSTSFFKTTVVPMVGAVTMPATPKVYTIGDVAKVTYDYAPVTTISRVNGKEALSVSITKTQEGNTVSVSHGVQDKISELKKKLGSDITVVTIFDQAPFVEKSLEQLSTEGLLGLGFAILIILLFLLSVRSTLVTAISIPTSVLITFIGLNTLGYSLNLLTLSALTIAIGRVVDDSIVVIENINRHLSYGEPKKKAVLGAVKEVSGAITAATITTVAVFAPIALVSGLVGELFRPFSFTFSIALIASLFVSLTIVPVLAYWFLKSPSEQAFKTEAAAKKHAAEIRELEEAKERKSILQRGYLPIITTTQKHPVLTIVASFIILIMTFSIGGLLKTDFIGSSGSGSVIANQKLEAGASLDDQSIAAAKVEKILVADKTVEVALTTIGSSGDARTALGLAAGGIQHQITLIKGADLEAFKARFLKAVEGDKTIGTVEFSASGGGSFGGSSTVDIKVTAKDDVTLLNGIEVVQKALTGTTGTTDITNSLADKQRTIQVTVNRKKAAAKGLSEIALSSIVGGLMQPTVIGSINVDGVNTSIYVVPKKPATTLAQIKNLAIPTMAGNVKLSTLAKVDYAEIPVSITTEKGDRTAKVMLTPDGKNLGATSVDVNKRLAKLVLPAGVTASLGGVSASQAQSFSDLGTALLAAVAIVFIVMVGTFRSIKQPLVLLISIPFAATGAFVALLVTDTALDVSALIGMLLLVGIVVTNAIVLIDLINQYRREGKGIQESILDGARQRLRPILMTALATIFALTPMAIGITGSGGFISQPLAIVVIGGLFSSTLLTLIIVPVLYWLIEGGKERKALKPKRVKKTTA